MGVNLDLGDTRLIIAECDNHDLTRHQTAYVLATAFWETGRSMKPIKETVMAHHKDKNPSDSEVIARLDRWSAKIGRTTNIYWRDGWLGRGYVQLTHRRNYEFAGQKLGLDLVNAPEMVMKPDIAARILVQGMMDGWFTGRGLPQYVGNGVKDYINARRVVNGTDKAGEIAAIADQYEAVLKDAPVVERKGFWEWFLSLFR